MFIWICLNSLPNRALSGLNLISTHLCLILISNLDKDLLNCLGISLSNVSPLANFTTSSQVKLFLVKPENTVTILPLLSM